MIEQPEPGPATVLLVDDSRAIRRILGRTLQDADYRVIEATDGQDGLDTARREHPDLILLDVDMPVMDGLSAMRVMRDDPDLARIPVLFLTARTSGSDAAAGLTLGARDYLRKPCEPEELLARVASALATSRLQQDLQSRTRYLDDLSTTDPLTGLGNRRRFDLWLADIRSTRGEDHQIAVALADIDHFKAINDSAGHLTGDTVLRILARRVRSTVSDDEMIVRWGGEEFLLVQSGAPQRPIAQAAETLRAAVAAEPMAVGVDQMLRVTVSVGCATGTVGLIADTIETADARLYRAKRGGRNCVVATD